MLEAFSTPFMQRAALVVVGLSVAAGIVGVHAHLRRLAFLAEALQHTIFPGIAIAFVWQGSLLLGAGVAAAATIVFLGLSARADIGHDSMIAVAVTIFFAGGVLAVSGRPGFQQDLTNLLFGRILALEPSQVLESLLVLGAAVAVVGLLHKELVASAFDPVFSKAAGLQPAVLNVVLNVCVALVVIAAVRAVGSVLLVAFVVTPAVAARLLSNRVPAMMLLASTLTAVGGLGGLLLAYQASVDHDLDVPAGAVMVLCITGLLLLAVLLGPALRRFQS